MLVRCTICEKQFETEKSPALPFCSQRCRDMDLGRWLDERYGLPYESEDEPEESRPDDADAP